MSNEPALPRAADFPREVTTAEDPRLLVFVGNPTQYHSPIFRKLSEVLGGRMQVMYGDDIGARPFFNPEVSAVIEWDISVLGGFPYKIFPNRASSNSKGFWSRNNPGLIGHVMRSPASHVLLHGYDTLSSWYVYFAALVSGKKIVWRGETVAKPGGGSGWREWLKRAVLPLYFRGVSTVLWSCLNNRDYLADHLGRQRHKFVRFPCAVDNDFFRAHRLDDNARAAARAARGIPADHMVIVTCSRLTARKRTHLIVDAMAKMSVETVTLLIIGDGPERSALEARARELGVSLVVTGFVGQVEVAELLSLSDVFVLLSVYDASPKALNEAMNFPLAMIASTGVGTARDLVRPGVNGHLFETGQDDALAHWLDDWANDPVVRGAMAAKNDDVLKDYTIEEGVANLVTAMGDG
ncbi:MAG: glycosyltransferase family 4 protein [Parvibaculum sp.]|uniref:glycosyltransferase family 4 protein n=1 Tax=Parvibaculum sp. TaxID=2024848 RepID=UPI0032EFD334